MPLLIFPTKTTNFVPLGGVEPLVNFPFCQKINKAMVFSLQPLHTHTHTRKKLISLLSLRL